MGYWTTDDLGQQIFVDDDGRDVVQFGAGGSGLRQEPPATNQAPDVVLNDDGGYNPGAPPPSVIGGGMPKASGKTQSEVELEAKLQAALEALKAQQALTQRGGTAPADSPYSRLLFPGYAAEQQRVAQAIYEQMQAEQAMSSFSNAPGVDYIPTPFLLADKAQSIADTTGIPVTRVKQIGAKLLGAGMSALVMAATGGNFPLGAMAYFAIDRAMSPSGLRDVFNGTKTDVPGVVDGLTLSTLGVEIPDGLPNEIFGDFRFICFDRLSGKFWPSDEVQPLGYQGGNEYRWLCLDRVTQRVYQANLIKRPRIYLD